MAVTQKQLGERLREARQEAKMSQEAVADVLNLPRPTISQIESGKRGVDSLELVKLAKLYRMPLSFFLEEQPEKKERESVVAMLFRAEIKNLTQEDEIMISEFDKLCRNYTWLERLLGYKRRLTLPMRLQAARPKNKGEAIREAENLAIEVRKLLDLGDDPICNVIDLLEQQGIRIVIWPLENKHFSGLFLEDEETGPCILINASHRPARTAYTAAHEYGHILLDRELKTKVCDEEKDLLDVRADVFAAAFLMPEKGIEASLKSLGKAKPGKKPFEASDVIALRRYFGVSYQALLFRLMNLNWLSEKEREELESMSPSLNKLEKILHEQGEVDLESRYPLKKDYLPERYQHLALEAYRQGKISIGKLAELLRKNLYEVRDLLKALKIYQVGELSSSKG
ncbi:MAG: ImmA/IrrE family metallo-endopeptidase [Nitrospirae bacterium]|nr:ImmA/IrrE family metallo-endopeptidase [Nitrospirota bacterium]